MSLEMLDMNGASRQIGIMLVVLVVSWTASMRIATLPRYSLASFPRVYPIVPLAGIMMFMAYGVRTPCRPNYYIGCGVNDVTYWGFGFAAALLIFGLVMALRWKMPVGWLIAAIAVYYGEYMQQFYHVLSPWWRLGIILALPCIAWPWVISVLRWTHAKCQP